MVTASRHARKKAGVEFLVGFETEFILLKSTNPIEAVSYHDYSASHGLPTGSIESRVLREISDALIKAGIEVTLYHPEGAPGQVSAFFYWWQVILKSISMRL